MWKVGSAVQCAAFSGMQCTEADGVWDEEWSDLLTQFIVVNIVANSFCGEISAIVSLCLISSL